MNRCILLLCLLLYACSNKPKTIYFDTDIVSSSSITEETTSKPYYSSIDTNDIIVPYQEVRGVKTIPVKVNGLGLNMIFDTGCSGTLISKAEANYLYQKGLLTPKEILGTSLSIIADGSLVENTVINLREVIVADKIICHNVQATVSDNISAPLLLGNEVLNRVASYTIDNINKTIIFKLR